jgi:hypothetical protein
LLIPILHLWAALLLCWSFPMYTFDWVFLRGRKKKFLSSWSRKVKKKMLMIIRAMIVIKADAKG